MKCWRKNSKIYHLCFRFKIVGVTHRAVLKRTALFLPSSWFGSNPWHRLNIHSSLRERLLISPLANVSWCHCKYYAVILYSLRSLSSPVRGAKKRTKQSLRSFLSKPQAWYIIDARSAAYIISSFGAVSHHALAWILTVAWWYTKLKFWWYTIPSELMISTPPAWFYRVSILSY